MDELAIVDHDLFLSLTRRYRYVFWQRFKGRAGDVMTGRFAISDEYCRWGTSGIICLLVEAVHTDQATGRKLRIIMNATQFEEMAYSIALGTSQWLARHNFPSQLVEHYAQGAEITKSQLSETKE
jgi:hypothetical protein